MKPIYYTLIIFIMININNFAQIFGGSALLLDGELDYVEIMDSPELTPPTSTITIEAWIKTDSSSSTRNIISKYNSNAGVDQLSWGLSVRQNDGVRFGVYESLNTYRTIDTDSGLIAADTWYHIAATFDISNQESHIYLNGEEVQSTLDPGSADSISFISDSDTPVRIGTIIPVSGSLTNFWDGYIDEVRIWNVARSKAQIQSTMNDTLTADYYSNADSGLVAYWRCDALEDLGINADGPDDIRDFSVFQNHGDLNGDAMLEVVVSVKSDFTEIPYSFLLEQNFPNPFNPTTKIKYSIPQFSNVIIKVFDILGDEIGTLVNEEKPKGIYELTWNAASFPSGVYFYQLRAGSFVETKKMILIK